MSLTQYQWLTFCYPALVFTPGCNAPLPAAPGSVQGICSLREGVQHPQEGHLLLLLWHTRIYPDNLLNLSQQQLTDLQQKPITTHLMAFANPQLQEGKCWEMSLSNVTCLGFLPPSNLEVVTDAPQTTHIHTSFSWRQTGSRGTDTPIGISTKRQQEEHVPGHLQLHAPPVVHLGWGAAVMGWDCTAPFNQLPPEPL